MPVEILPAAKRARRRFVQERDDEAGLAAAQRLNQRFQEVLTLLETRELGSTRQWAPPQYKFIPIDVFHLIWRYDPDRPDVRVVVLISHQSARTSRTVGRLH